MTFLLVVAVVVAFIMLARLRSAASELRARVDKLDRELIDLRGGLDRLAAERVPAPRPSPEEAPAVVARPAPAPPPSRPSPAPPVVEPRIPASAPPPRRVEAPAEPPLPLPPAPIPRPASGTPPAPSVPEAMAGTPRRAEIEGWESAIGGSWLNRIGIALLVIGIALALGYSLTILGPAGKAALATAVSLALIAGGVLLERREPYAFYARGLIGGGWAALYATAYAMHELEATRVVEKAVAGFALLLAVGGGMIFHSLRYRNQGLTSLAYGLGYAAIVMHSISTYTVFAASLLGAGTVAHLLRRRWYGLAIGGAAATYGSLFLWYLRQTTMDGATLRAGLSALALNWIVFLVAEFGPDPAEDHEKNQLRIVSLLNALGAGGLSLAAWRRFSPAGAWIPPAILGTAYVITSTALRRAGRAVAHPLHSLAASLLVAGAAYEGLDRRGATWVWLAEAQAVVLMGAFLKDRFHRILGSALFLAPMLAIVSEQGGARLRGGEGILQWSEALMTAAACGCFYLTWVKLREFDSDSTLRRLFSYGAFGLILLALWVQLPSVYVAPAGALLALLLLEVSSLKRETDLRIQCHMTALFATAAALALTLPRQGVPGAFSSREPALLIVAAAFYAIFARTRDISRHLLESDPQARRVIAWGGAAFLVLALWLALPAVWFPPAVALVMVLLFELSHRLREGDLRGQGYLCGVVAGMAAIGLAPAPQPEVAGLPGRVVAMLAVALAYFALFLRQRGGARGVLDVDAVVRPLLSWGGTFLLCLAIWIEARTTLVGPAWMLLALLLVEAGIGLKEMQLRRPGYAALAAALVSVVFSNIVPEEIVSGWSSRAATVVPVIAATYYLWWRLRELSLDPAGRKGDAVDETFGRILSYAGAGVAGLFFRFQFGLDGAALRWSLAMAALFVAGYLLRDADFRIQAYGLAGGITVRAIGFDFVSANPVLGVNGPFAVALVAAISLCFSGWYVGLRQESAVAAPIGGRTAAWESLLAGRGRDILWVLAVLLTALYFYRTLSGFVLIVGWAIEGLVVSGAGFGVRVRSLRLAGLGLLAIGLAMTFYRAFTTFDTMGRIISFMVMGIVLLLISFAYTRYRDVIRRNV